MRNLKSNPEILLGKDMRNLFLETYFLAKHIFKMHVLCLVYTIHIYQGQAIEIKNARDLKEPRRKNFLITLVYVGPLTNYINS